MMKWSNISFVMFTFIQWKPTGNIIDVYHSHTLITVSIFIKSAHQ